MIKEKTYEKRSKTPNILIPINKVYAKNYKKAMKMIDFAHEEYKKGSEDFCINYGSVKK